VNILAIETSTEHCSVALWRDGAVDEAGAHAGQRHSALLLPMLHGLLERRGLKVANLDGLAFGEGPGSFTGLRIACGVVQGLAFGAGLKVVGVGTLLAMAAGSGADRAVCCLDARMGEIYHAAYARSASGWEIVHAPGLWAPEEAPAVPPGGWTGCGSGFAAYPQALTRRYPGLSAIVPEAIPYARHVAGLAAREFAAGRAVPPERAVPVYLRDKVALKTAEQR
jgi:tRNA threonylcarbamoyladenosine biosynthesis protein TsaB